MTENIWIPLFSAFGGAVVGAVSSIVAIWLQQRSLLKREKLRLACEIAQDDRKHRIDLANDKGIAVSIPGVSVFLHYHLLILEALENGNLNKEKLEKIKKENEALREILSEKIE